jgi:predicted GNAT superfamily acetyltransferase
MKASEIHTISPSELSGGGSLGTDLIALNNADAQALSWLEPERLAHLVRQSFLARRIGRGDAFLLAFDQDADYDSVNFLWFRKRYDKFVYVDRIVVAPVARGRGYGRQFSMDLFELASRAGHRLVVCEVNADPPNPISDAFHAALGFMVVGSETVQGRSKTVRYFCRYIGTPSVAFRAGD